MLTYADVANNQGVPTVLSELPSTPIFINTSEIVLQSKREFCACRYHPFACVACQGTCVWGLKVLVYAALRYSVLGLKLLVYAALRHVKVLVYAALSYLCMRP